MVIILWISSNRIFTFFINFCIKMGPKWHLHFPPFYLSHSQSARNKIHLNLHNKLKQKKMFIVCVKRHILFKILPINKRCWMYFCCLLYLAKSFSHSNNIRSITFAHNNECVLNVYIIHIHQYVSVCTLYTIYRLTQLLSHESEVWWFCWMIYDVQYPCVCTVL